MQLAPMNASILWKYLMYAALSTPLNELHAGRVKILQDILDMKQKGMFPYLTDELLVGKQARMTFRSSGYL